MAGTALGILVLVALGIASRAGSVATRDTVPYNPRPASERIVVGVVGSSQGPGGRADAEVLRGLRLWAAKLTSSGGIPYTPNQSGQLKGRFRGPRAAPVELRVASADGTAAGAVGAARRLVAQGAQVLVAPTALPQLEAVSQFAGRRRVLLLAARQPPRAAGSPRTGTYFALPDAEQLDGTFDALEHSRPRHRVAILYPGAALLPRVRLAIEAAGRHDFRVHALDVSRLGVHAALVAARRPGPDVVVALGPVAQAAGWFRSARASGPQVPWVAVAADASAAARAAGAGPMAIEVPWSPAGPQDGVLFTARGEFTTRYESAYGGAPTPDAAAGAALGLILDRMVYEARSTDPSRMLRARGSMMVPSPWGTITFHGGRSRPVPSQLVLAKHGRVEHVDPPLDPAKAAAELRLFRSSVPR